MSVNIDIMLFLVYTCSNVFGVFIVLWFHVECWKHGQTEEVYVLLLIDKWLFAIDIFCCYWWDGY